MFLLLHALVVKMSSHEHLSFIVVEFKYEYLTSELKGTQLTIHCIVKGMLVLLRSVVCQQTTGFL